jgi:hypothetical protein
LVKTWSGIFRTVARRIRSTCLLSPSPSGRGIKGEGEASNLLSVPALLGSCSVAILAFGSLATARAAEPIDAATMQRVHDEVKTPFKYGVVLRGDSTNQLVDCLNIFRRDGKWLMMYVAISNKVGSETYLA